MKVLVTGVNGQLGHDVMNELAKRGYEGVGVDVAEMDRRGGCAQSDGRGASGQNGSLRCMDCCGCGRG